VNLKSEIINKIINISEEYENIKKVVLFGSRARGNNSEKSDIDLAIYCDDDISEYIEEIEETVPTLLEFDFSDMRKINDELFIEQVEKEGITLYEKH
jgi:predicted nucleotidyltransferase